MITNTSDSLRCRVRPVSYLCSSPTMAGYIHDSDDEAILPSGFRRLPPSILVRTPTILAPRPPEDPGAQSDYQFTPAALTRELGRYNLGPDMTRDLPHDYRGWLWHHRLAFAPPRRNPHGGEYNQFPVCIKIQYFNLTTFWFHTWQEAQPNDDHYDINLASWRYNFEAWNPRTTRATPRTIVDQQYIFIWNLRPRDVFEGASIMRRCPTAPFSIYTPDPDFPTFVCLRDALQKLAQHIRLAWNIVIPINSIMMRGIRHWGPADNELMELPMDTRICDSVWGGMEPTHLWRQDRPFQIVLDAAVRYDPHNPDGFFPPAQFLDHDSAGWCANHLCTY